MWRRRTVWLILFVIAVLAVSFTLIPDRVRAPNVSPPPETANEDSEAAPGDASSRDAETALEDVPGREEAVDDHSRPESGPEPEQPENDAIRITGRLIWTPPGGHEDYTSLERMGATVNLWFWSDEHPDAGIDIDDVPVDADGGFSIDLEAGDSRELLLTQGLSFDLWIGFEADGNTISRKVEPTVRGRVLDFGEIAFGLGDTLHEGSWVVTGRLLSPGGTPFARQSTFNLLCFRDSWPMPIYVQTDPDGWFVETYELATVHGQHESPVPPMQESDWWLDIGDTGYTVEEIWNFEDALIEMPQPAVDRDNREVSFGDVTVDASTVTVKVSLSEKARRALRNEGEDSLISIDLSMANVDDGYSHILRHDRDSILCVLPGRYAIKAEFKLIPADDYDPSGGGKIVFPETNSELPTLPNSGDWAVQHEILNIGPGEHKVLELKVEPVREVQVHVNTPDGPATSADLRLVQETGNERDRRSFRLEESPLPVVVRSDPSLRETLEVSVKGYAPAIVEIPPTGEELTVSLEKADPLPVNVRFSGEEPPGFPPVRLIARNGLMEIEQDVEDLDRPAVLPLPPGEWRVSVLPAEEPDERKKLCLDADVTVGHGAANEVQLPLLSWPYLNSYFRRVMAGNSVLDGTALALRNDGDRRWRCDFDSERMVGIYDGDELHQWKYETRNGTIYGKIQLPVRIRLNIPPSLQGRGDSLTVTCDYRGGEYETAVKSDVCTLWAPPGACRVSLSGGKGSPIQSSWWVKVVKDEVIELTAPTEFGRVRLEHEPRTSVTGEEFRSRLSRPNWLIFRAGETERHIEAISPRNSEPSELTLPVGEYEIRAAYGPDASRPIAVSVASGLTVDVRLPFPEGVPANGRVLLALPEGVFGWVDVWVDWPGRHSGDWLSYWNRERIVDGKLLVDGLLVGEPIKLTIELSCYGDGNRQSWSGKTAEFVLTDSEQTPVDIEWVIED